MRTHILPIGWCSCESGPGTLDASRREGYGDAGCHGPTRPGFRPGLFFWQFAMGCRDVGKDPNRTEMAGTCVVGLQWGDAGKGQIVDLFGDQFDFVVRYRGGANAGHTVVVNGKTFKLSLLPTGVIRPNVTSVIGNGVVVYPPRFLEEVDQLAKGGLDVSKSLVVSDHAHVIFPYHMEEERIAESDDEGKIGTTGRG